MTLNELIEKHIRTAVESSPFVKYFGVGDLEKYGLSGDMKFPFAWLTVRRVRRRDNVFDFDLSIVFGDSVNYEETNVIEIQSDMIGVAAEVAGRIVHSPVLEMDESFTLDPFVQRFTDLTAGVVMDFTVTARASLAGCEDC